MADEVTNAPPRSTAAASWIFRIAGIYGLLAFATMIVHTPDAMRDSARTAPEMFWGFISVGIAWQAVFLMIGSNPRRYRPLMVVAAVLEKFGFVVPALVLILQKTISSYWLTPVAMDFLLGCAFLVAYALTPKPGTSCIS